MLASGALAPVHKFSKFVHGCAVLLPDEVQAMPYWVDDPALAPSIRATGASGASLLRRPSPPRPRAARPSRAFAMHVQSPGYVSMCAKESERGREKTEELCGGVNPIGDRMLRWGIL